MVTPVTPLKRSGKGGHWVPGSKGLERLEPGEGHGGGSLRPGGYGVSRVPVCTELDAGITGKGSASQVFPAGAAEHSGKDAGSLGAWCWRAGAAVPASRSPERPE